MPTPERSAAPQSRSGAPDLYIGSRIRMARERAPMSRDELGRRIGVTAHQIRNYETGHSQISATALHRIALASRQPVAFFFPQPEPVCPSADTLLPAELRALIETLGSPEALGLNAAFGRIADAKLRREVVALVRAIADGLS